MITKKRLLFAIVFLCFGVAINFLSKSYLSSIKEKPMLDDILYKFLPYLKVLKITEVIIGLSIILFVIYIFKYKMYTNMYNYIIMIGIFQLIRGIFVLLNPVNPIVESDSLIRTLDHTGMFPSGHISLPFFFYLFAYNKPNSVIFLILTILVGFGLLISRAHYSIDVLGSIFIVYSIVNIYERYSKW